MARKGIGKKNLLDRSMDLLREVSDRFHRNAGRATLSSLRVELAALKRQRAEALRILGESVQTKITAGSLTLDDLAPLSSRIADLDHKISSASAAITKIVSVSARRATSGDKAPRQSQRLALVADTVESRTRAVEATVQQNPHDLSSGASTPADSAALPIDPLEDILGVAEEAEFEEIDRSGDNDGDPPIAGAGGRKKGVGL